MRRLLFLPLILIISVAVAYFLPFNDLELRLPGQEFVPPEDFPKLTSLEYIQHVVIEEEGKPIIVQISLYVPSSIDPNLAGADLVSIYKWSMRFMCDLEDPDCVKGGTVIEMTMDSPTVCEYPAPRHRCSVNSIAAQMALSQVAITDVIEFEGEISFDQMQQFHDTVMRNSGGDDGFIVVYDEAQMPYLRPYDEQE